MHPSEIRTKLGQQEVVRILNISITPDTYYYGTVYSYPDDHGGLAFNWAMIIGTTAISPFIFEFIPAIVMLLGGPTGIIPSEWGLCAPLFFSSYSSSDAILVLILFRAYRRRTRQILRLQFRPSASGQQGSKVIKGWCQGEGKMELATFIATVLAISNSTQPQQQLQQQTGVAAVYGPHTCYQDANDNGKWALNTASAQKVYCENQKWCGKFASSSLVVWGCVASDSVCTKEGSYKLTVADTNGKNVKGHFYCCTGDYCNPASTYSISFALLAAVIVKIWCQL
ncbi:unnamed protein product, partial [Mesorhabditis spiculigera]